MPSAAERRRHRRERGVLDREARVGGEGGVAGGARDRRRVAVERDQAAARRQPRQHRARMAAAAERAVDVDAVGVGDERVDRLGQENAQVLQGAGAGIQKLKFLSESGIGDCITAASCAAWRCASQSSKWLPMPSSITSRTRPADGAQLGGDQHRATTRRSRRPSRCRGRRASSRSNPSAAPATRSRKCSHAGRGKISSEPSGCLVTVSWWTPIAASSSRWRAGIAIRPLPSSVSAAGP